MCSALFLFVCSANPAAQGGFPTRMTVTLFPVFTEAEVAELSVADLCDQAQVRMQAQLDRLYALEDKEDAGAGGQPNRSEARTEQKEDSASEVRQRKVRAL